MQAVYSSGAATPDSRIGGGISSFLHEKEAFTGLADAGTIIITHGADPENKRIVKVVNAAGLVLNAPAVTVTHTSATVTTVTNATGGALAGEVHLLLPQ